MKTISLKMLAIGLVFCLCCSCAALKPSEDRLSLPSIFGDHMMLQRDMDVPVWGWASPGEKITVVIDTQQKRAKADKQGNWRVTLDPLPAGGPHTMTISGVNGSITVSDILVGDVWFCSGQSNMQMTVKQAQNSEEEIADATYPRMRLFTVKQATSSVKPATDCEGIWQICSPETVGDFSAAGYYFGRYLHKNVNVPIGLVCSAWGGTRIEAWTSKEALQQLAWGRSEIDVWEKEAAAYDHETEMKQYEERLAKWEQEDEATRKRKPRPPVKPEMSQHAPATLFNGMVAPVIPFAIKGAIWYQGEANSRSPEMALAYRELLPNMIRDWRTRWEEGDFPFIYVQLPNYKNPGWPLTRESMLEALSTPNTGMAITIDIGMTDNIHPVNKQEVGRRLALNAMHLAYGKDLVYTGPIFKSMTVKDGSAILEFEHTGSGLIAKGGPLKGFEVAGDDHTFAPADARIEGDKVIVTSGKVENPVAVRYAWAADPDCNLYNAEGLPASPFRTDRWELETE